jgi:7-carboxy-7-deazaguanine synthase (Cx14CxxC type)
MSYTVKELFLTAQGEGANIGRVAVFIRFAGCNLWSGREEDRATAVCRFCDTEFVGGKRYRTAEALADAAAALWPADMPKRMAVLTGGEPLLQVDAALLAALRERWFYTAVETNGTQALPAHIDWVCVSPKAGAPLVLRDADELKLVYPQKGAEPEKFAEFAATHRWLSPMDLPRRRKANTAAAAAYCLAHPQWRLAVQAHKTWAIP